MDRHQPHFTDNLVDSNYKDTAIRRQRSQKSQQPLFHSTVSSSARTVRQVVEEHNSQLHATSLEDTPPNWSPVNFTGAPNFSTPTRSPRNMARTPESEVHRKQSGLIPRVWQSSSPLPSVNEREEVEVRDEEVEHEEVEREELEDDDDEPHFKYYELNDKHGDYQDKDASSIHSTTFSQATTLVNTPRNSLTPSEFLHPSPVSTDHLTDLPTDHLTALPPYSTPTHPSLRPRYLERMDHRLTLTDHTFHLPSNTPQTRSTTPSSTRYAREPAGGINTTEITGPLTPKDRCWFDVGRHSLMGFEELMVHAEYEKRRAMVVRKEKRGRWEGVKGFFGGK